MRMFIFALILLLPLVSAADEVTAEVKEPFNRNYDLNEFNWMLPVYGLLLIGAFGLAFYFRNGILGLFKSKKKTSFLHLIGIVENKLNKNEKENDIIKNLSAEGWHRIEIEKAITKAKNGFFTPKKREDIVVNHVRNVFNSDRQEEVIKDIKELKEELKEEMPKILNDDVKRVLKLTDEMLGKMPENNINDFVNSPDFETYKKVMKKVYEPMQKDNNLLERIDKVITLLQKGIINKEEARKLLGLSEFRINKGESLEKEELLNKLKETKNYE